MPNALPLVNCFTEKNKARFVSKIDKNGPVVREELGPCWLWTSSLTKKGYGKFSVGRKDLRAHRVSFAINVGPVPDGLHVLHHCDVRNCVSPQHLFLGTNEDNVLDMCSKGRKESGSNHWTKRFPDRVARGNQSGAILHPEILPRGERQHLAKLTDAKVAEMRRAYAEGGVTYSCLAIANGVSLPTAIRAIRGETWAHVR